MDATRRLYLELQGIQDYREIQKDVDVNKTIIEGRASALPSFRI